MFISELTALRDEWFAVGRVDPSGNSHSELVTLFGDEYVLFVDADGTAGLVQPRCPHRGAHLASAQVLDMTLRCCYHGWEFTAQGRCSAIPQLDVGLPIPPKAHLAHWPVVERYGLYWACVGNPESSGPPPWYEADTLGWRVQVDFFELWNASALRIVDNNIDQAHPAFVHRDTFGDRSRPEVPRYEVEKTAGGFRAMVRHTVAGVGPQMGIYDESLAFERLTDVELLSPVHTRILLAYGGQAPDYCFYGSATPIDDARSMYVRISALMGTEAEQPYAMFWDFSRRVTHEDRVVLEATSSDFPTGVTDEVHLRCDRTTLEYRRILGRLATGQGVQNEVPTAVVGGVV